MSEMAFNEYLQERWGYEIGEEPLPILSPLDRQIQEFKERGEEYLVEFRGEQLPDGRILLVDRWQDESC